MPLKGRMLWMSGAQPKPHYPETVTRATVQVALAVQNGQSREFAVSQLSSHQKTALKKAQLL